MRLILRGIVAVVLCCAGACHKLNGHEVGSESHFLACDRSSECAVLGDGFECRQGTCAPIAPPPAGAPAPPPPPTTVPPVASSSDCGLTTTFVGDDQCLVAPAASSGLQVHVGPKNYADAAELADWVLQPGEEQIDCFSFRTSNTEDVNFAEWEYSSRPGMHHSVFSLFDLDLADGKIQDCVHPGTVEPGKFIGTLTTAHTMSVARTPPTQENRSIGWPVPAKAAGQVQLHAYNFTDLPILREAWLNMYLPQQPPTQIARPVRLIGGTDWVIAPNDERTDRFTCPIASNGRLLSLMTYPLQSIVSVDAWLRRSSGERIPLLQTTNGSEPRLFAYDSVTTNPAFAELADGAHSGIVSFESGDALEWQCHILNRSPQSLTHVHDELRGAICDLTGMTIGPQLDCTRP